MYILRGLTCTDTLTAGISSKKSVIITKKCHQKPKSYIIITERKFPNMDQRKLEKKGRLRAQGLMKKKTKEKPLPVNTVKTERNNAYVAYKIAKKRREAAEEKGIDTTTYKQKENEWLNEFIKKDSLMPENERIWKDIRMQVG